MHFFVMDDYVLTSEEAVMQNTLKV